MMNYTKVMAWFIIIVMALSVLGYVGGSFFSNTDTNNKMEYNGFRLLKTNEQWTLKIADNKYNFQYSPPELENLSLPAGINFNTAKIYLGFQPGHEVEVGRYINALAATIYNNNILAQQACIVEDGCPDIPIIDCENKKGVILKSGTAGFSQVDNCLVLKAEDGAEMQKLTERLIYQLLGVMN